MATSSLITALDNPFERIPPQSLEAEQAVLGGILIDVDALNRVIELVKPADFYRHAHQLVYEAALELFNKSEPVDIITVSEVLSDKGLLENVGGRSYVNDLALSIATTDNIDYYARIIREKSILRRLIHAGTEIAVEAYETVDANSAVDKAQQAIFEIAQQGMPEDLVHIKEILPVTFEQIEERHANKGSLMGVPSGFIDLDNLTSGFQKSDLIILAARPSMGKTAFCLNILSNVALLAHKPAIIFSLEMSKEQLVQRMLCSEAELDAQKIRSGHITEQEFVKLSQAMGKLGDSPIYIDDSPGLSVMELRAKARKMILELGQEVGIIVIDYLQLMEGSSSSRNFGDSNRTQEISAISRGLKGIARELKVPIIALSQLSRAVESRQDKKPMLSDLRESGSIEQDADLVMFIYRDEYYNKDSERMGQADIIIAKQRNGPVGEVALLFQSNITKFKSMYDPGARIF